MGWVFASVLSSITRFRRGLASQSKDGYFSLPGVFVCRELI